MGLYGIKRLVAINSGNYSIAVIDLGTPVHLAADNNRGKTTLVNALQFLYIDDYQAMRFGQRSHDDTARHYFGHDRSYLIFECQTPTGTQSMLVRGLGATRVGAFERYVYGGEFQKADFVKEDGEIREFDAVRSQLGDRQLTKIPKGALWQVLSGAVPSEEEKTLPRLNLLPIRRRDEYLAFRNVFVRLLSLSNVKARELRQLVIESHASDVGERTIDVVALYKEEYARAERSERELQFIQSIIHAIDRGHELRGDVQALLEELRLATPSIWRDARRAGKQLDDAKAREKTEEEELESQCRKTQEEMNKLLGDQGEAREQRKGIEREQEQLNKSEAKWSAYSSELISNLRQNSREKAAAVVKQDQLISDARGLDQEGLRRRIHDLKQRIAADQRALKQWDQTVAAELRKGGLSEKELEKAFKIANPELLKLIMGDDVSIVDAKALQSRIRNLARQVKDGTYADDVVKANVSDVGGLDSGLLNNREPLRLQVRMNENAVKESTAALIVAENEDKARAERNRLLKESERLQNEVADYDRHATAWAARDTLVKRLSDAMKVEAELGGKLGQFEKLVEGNNKKIGQAQRRRKKITELSEALKTAAKDFEREAGRIHLDPSFLSSGENGDTKEPTFEELEFLATGCVEQLKALSRAAQRIEAHGEQVREIEGKIVAHSQLFEGQQRYFSDADEEWRLLIESRDSLVQREAANAKNWDALFTTLSARLNGIVTAVRNIKLAVERINRGLKTYRVSNLRAVEIRVEEERDVFPMIEALAAPDSLFTDRGSLEGAKKQLRRMIEENQTIDLQSLFELRIRIQNADQVWREAGSLDEIGSTGTGMTAKAMIFIQLVRAVARNEKYRLHFYIDGLGELDDQNLEATAAMAVSKGILPITADPRIHLEPLAHPDVTVYALGQGGDGRFFVDASKTYHARRRSSKPSPLEANSE